MNTNDRSILQTILSLLDVLSSHRSEGQSWIHLLSLLCIFTILNQPTASVSSSAASDPPANPLQKILGELTKGAVGGANGGDTLLSLLPLMNSPQIKSKLNPSSIAAMMNIVQNLAGTQPAPTAKPPAPPPPAVSDVQPASAPPAATTPAPAPTPPASTSPSKSEIPAGGRFLDWKSSF